MTIEGKTSKQRFWKDHSAAWKASGLTQQAYCEREGISYPSFVYQHNRLTSQPKKPVLNFVEAKPIQAEMNSQTASLQLMFPNGVRVGIGGEISTTLLETVLTIAGNLTC